MKRRSFILTGAATLATLDTFGKNIHKGGHMITHLADTRGFANHGWLKSHHTFSFADYYDPGRMQFGALRVINDDYIAAGMGFGTHPHRDMEIVTIPLEGALAHKDSTGNSKIIRKGEVQIMSAGTGIAHSEFNASQTDHVTLLQIWVLPKKMNVKPRYEQTEFTHEGRKNKLQTVVAPDGRDGAVTINQDAFFTLTDLDAGKSVKYDVKIGGNGVYVFVIKGEIEVNGNKLNRRDGAGLTDVESLDIKASSDAEVLLMEVPV